MAIKYSKNKDGGAGRFAPLPEGHYHIRIDDVVQTVSKKGNPQLELSTTIVDGEYTERHPKMWYSLLATASWRLDKLFDVVGITPAETGEYDEDGNPIMAADEQELVGRTVVFNVTQRDYQGRTNNNFDEVELSEYDAHASEEEAEDEEAPAPKPAGKMRRRARPGR